MHILIKGVFTLGFMFMKLEVQKHHLMNITFGLKS